MHAKARRRSLAAMRRVLAHHTVYYAAGWWDAFIAACDKYMPNFDARGARFINEGRLYHEQMLHKEG